MRIRGRVISLVLLIMSLVGIQANAVGINNKAVIDSSQRIFSISIPDRLYVRVDSSGNIKDIPKIEIYNNSNDDIVLKNVAIRPNEKDGYTIGNDSIEKGFKIRIDNKEPSLDKKVELNKIIDRAKDIGIDFDIDSKKPSSGDIGFLSYEFDWRVKGVQVVDKDDREYIEGDAFNKGALVVKEILYNGSLGDIVDKIEVPDGDSLKGGQTTVIIKGNINNVIHSTTTDIKMKLPTLIDVRRMYKALQSLEGSISFVVGKPPKDGIDISKYQNGSIVAVVEADSAIVYCKETARFDPDYDRIYFKITTSPIYTIECSGYFSYYMCKQLSIGNNAITLDNVEKLDSMFAGMHNLENLDLDGLDTSNIKSARGMFYYNTARLKIDNMDTSNIEDMTGMFYGCKDTVRSLDLSSLNTDKVVVMDYMFNNFSGDILDVSNFGSKNLKSMHSMFNNISVNDIILSNFETSNVEDMEELFSNSEIKSKELDLSSFDTSSVVNMQKMFYNICGNKNAHYPGDGIKLILSEEFSADKVKSMNSMFLLAKIDGELNLEGFKNSAVTDTSSMFSGCTVASINLPKFNPMHAVNMSNMFNGNIRELKITNAFKTDSAVNMSYMFSGYKGSALDLSGFNTSNVNDMSYMFYNCSNLVDIDLSSFNTHSVTNMNSMFYGCTSANKLDLSSFDTSNVETMVRMFYSCGNTADLIVGNGFVDDNVTDMRYAFESSHIKDVVLPGFKGANVLDVTGMFKDYWSSGIVRLPNFEGRSVTTTKSMFDNSKCKIIDIPKFTTDSVTDMSYMFSHASVLRLDLSHFNTSRVVSMSNMFSYCYNLEELDITTFKADSLKNVDNMFYASKLLRDIKLNLNTINVESMVGMFRECEGLVELDLTSLNTSNVINMSSMFSGCKALKNVELSSFDTSNVTDMSSMFRECENLVDIDLHNFNTNNVINMEGMFYKCRRLIGLDLSNFDTGRVRKMSHMFGYCYKLNSLKQDFNTIQVEDMAGMFERCSGFDKLDLSNIKFGGANIGRMFSYTKIKELNLGNIQVQVELKQRNVFDSAHIDRLICPEDTANWLKKNSDRYEIKEVVSPSLVV